MAQTIQIPVSFEFRTTPAKWEAVPAVITGWWRRDDGIAEGEELVAEVVTSLGVRSIKLQLGQLPLEQWELCCDAFEEDDAVIESERADDRVMEICSSFRPTLLVHSGNTYPRDSEWTKHSSPADAWQLRDGFLRTTLDYESAVAFLNKWGTWSHASYVGLKGLVRLQESVREALTGSTAQWLATPELFLFPTLWRRIPEYPYFVLRTNLGRDAIAMTVTVDLLKKAKFEICARPDCAIPFAIQSKHRRKFCQQYCGHLESVRRNRKPKSAQLTAPERSH